MTFLQPIVHIGFKLKITICTVPTRTCIFLRNKSSIVIQIQCYFF